MGEFSETVRSMSPEALKQMKEDIRTEEISRDYRNDMFEKIGWAFHQWAQNMKLTIFDGEDALTDVIEIGRLVAKGEYDYTIENPEFYIREAE